MSTDDRCAFCRIAAGKAPARIAMETASTIAFFPDTPATRGHTLVVPKRHVSSFLNLEDVEAGVLMASVLRVGRALRELLKPEGMNAIMSAGAAASQTVHHVHVHLVPRWPGDEMGELWPPKVEPNSGELDELQISLSSMLGRTSIA